MTVKNIVSSYCGKINPGEISTYISLGGFKAFTVARKSMSPKEVIDMIKHSGLTGRGGAGFNSGMKWELAKKSKSSVKYLICNADEGEVGTFKDRHLLMKDPFSLIEGMAIAGYAIGIQKAFIYLRAEYRYIRAPLTNAIQQAKENGYLDHMDIEVFMGAGAYICGEETALMNSIEGYRGESRFKPPYPPVHGLWDKPTVINNVETLMNVPHIILNGPLWFNNMGTIKSKGTKLFCVSGDVARPGVYELVMGSTLKELVVDIAGASDIKAVQVGGATGNIIPWSLIETPLANETSLGSGAVMVIGKNRSIIDIVSNDMHFFSDESCGFCTPCREGTEVMMEIFGRLKSGAASETDIKTLEDLSSVMSQASLCGLGQSAVIPVIDSLKYFKEEYVTRINQSAFLKSIPGNLHTISKEDRHG